MDKTNTAELAAALDMHANLTAATCVAWAVEELYVAARLYDEAGELDKAQAARDTAAAWTRARQG